MGPLGSLGQRGLLVEVSPPAPQSRPSSIPARLGAQHRCGVPAPEPAPHREPRLTVKQGAAPLKKPSLEEE